MTTPAPTRLWNRDFLLLWLGLIQSYLGDAFYTVGLTWLLLNTTGSPTVVATALGIQALPKLLGPLAGVVVDRTNKKALMIGCDLARGVLLGAMFLLESMGMLAIWQIYIFIILMSLLSIFYMPSLRVILPKVVPDTALPSANSALQFGLQAALIGGGSLAGALLAFTDVAAGLLIDAGSFFVCALMLCFVRFPADMTKSSALSPRQVWGDIGEGFRYIATKHTILALAGLAFCLNLVLSPVNIIFPIFAEQLGSGVQGFGILTSALAAGLLVGSLLAGLIGDRLTPLQAFALGLSGMALALLGLGYAQVFALALGLAVLLGSMAPIIQVPLVSLLQRSVPQEYQGRVFATIDTMMTISIPLASLLAGQSLSLFPLSWVFWGGAAGVAALVLVCLLAMRRQALPEAQPSPS
ncbi:MFS transporter [Chloroflexia bacterium SDU3-3]|nr:MFS transporter [Chloroflexia bacterium SDU3-3]